MSTAVQVLRVDRPLCADSRPSHPSPRNGKVGSVPDIQLGF